jgi:hypothetical protein
MTLLRWGSSPSPPGKEAMVPPVVSKRILFLDSMVASFI